MLKRVKIKNIKSKKDLINMLYMAGQKTVADRLLCLHSLDILNTYETPLLLKSLQGLVAFVIKREKFPVPELNRGNLGLLTATWKNKKHGILSISFVDENHIQIAWNKFNIENINGTLMHSTMYNTNKILMGWFGLQ